MAQLRTELAVLERLQENLRQSVLRGKRDGNALRLRLGAVRRLGLLHGTVVGGGVRGEYGRRSRGDTHARRKLRI